MGLNYDFVVFGIGTDIIEVGRIEKQLNSGTELKKSLFTDSEIIYCESKKFQFQHFAARFAAKEAFFKALGTGWRYGMKYKEIEIKNNDIGKPEIFVSGRVKEELEEKKIIKIHLSITHLNDLANAFVILETN